MTSSPRPLVWHKSPGRPLHMARRSHQVEIHLSVNGVAHSNSLALQEFSHTITLCLHREVGLRLGSVLGRIQPCLVRALGRVERQHIHSRRAEHGQLEVMGHDPLIILRQPSPKRHAVGVLIVLLLGLLWPREEEPARSTVLQAVPRRARV